MKKLLTLAVLSMFFLPTVMAGSFWGVDSQSIPLAEKNPLDWSVVPDGDCNGLDYTMDSKVNQRDTSFVRRNKIDANNDGVYNSKDIKFIRANFQDCSAGKGEVTLSYNVRFGKISYQRVRATAQGLEPKTEYTLIYYGDKTHNDVYPYVTCIKTHKTSTQGYFKMNSMKFDWMPFIDDGINQKFWIVKTADLDCENGVLTAFNPSEYLFELASI